MVQVEEISGGRCSVCGAPATEDWQKYMARAVQRTRTRPRAGWWPGKLSRPSNDVRSGASVSMSASPV